MIDRQGYRWWTTAQACAHLGVHRFRLADWVRRSRLAGHTTPAKSCPACAAGSVRFPHVDPPMRAGVAAAYLADQLLEAEWWTRDQTRPRAPRR